MTPKREVWVYWNALQGRLEVCIPPQASAEIVFPPEFAGRRTGVVSGGEHVFEAK